MVKRAYESKVPDCKVFHSLEGRTLVRTLNRADYSLPRFVTYFASSSVAIALTNASEFGSIPDLNLPTTSPLRLIKKLLEIPTDFASVLGVCLFRRQELIQWGPYPRL